MAYGEKSFEHMRTLSLILVSLILFACSYKKIDNVKTGAEVLVSDSLELIKNRNLGIITNHTGILESGIHLVDTLIKIDDINVTALFGPEHGIRGDAPDGQLIEDGIDSTTGLRVYSLYGKTRKPISEMLNGIDLLIFDIQDNGSRFYTYISIMYYSLQAAAENNIPIIILDRPNPIGGVRVEGPVLDREFISFVGISEIPIRHGMTVGELSLFFNRKEILDSENIAELKVLKMQNWKREYYYDDCGIKWTKPSPNMPTLETAIVYPGLCLLEATNISEGRGTFSPFLRIGSPFLESNRIYEEIAGLEFEGISIKPIEFIPVAIPNMSIFPKYKNEKCYGIEITITDRNNFKPIDFGVSLIYLFKNLYPKKFMIKVSRMNKLWGNSNFTNSIKKGTHPKEIIKSYSADLEIFKDMRKSYLLYN